MTDRKATNVWKGDLMSGTGQVSFDSTGVAGPLDVSWPARAEEPGSQTSPEELIAAAHASCYNMGLSSALSKGGNTPEELATSAVVTFSMEGGPHVSNIAIQVRARVPGISRDDFLQAANAAKGACPVSKLVAGNVNITLEAELE